MNQSRRRRYGVRRALGVAALLVALFGTMAHGCAAPYDPTTPYSAQ